MKKLLGAGLISLFLTSCSMPELTSVNPLENEPKVASATKSGNTLLTLPPARQKVVVALYSFEDQTGQYKPSDDITDYSRAVTQGGLAIVSKALLDAGNRSWFTVVERGGLKNLMQERQIIRAMRDQYTLPSGESLPDIGPLLYAGVLLEGGIVSYESNILTGGMGAKWLGVGGSTEYRRDLVTVYLRATSIQTGEVLLSVNTSKTIFSSSLQGGAYRYVSLNRLLELESGVSVNEPPQFAVRQAIEMAVYSMVMEGAIGGLWEFADNNAGAQAIADYINRRDQGASLEDRAEAQTPDAPEQVIRTIEPNETLMPDTMNAPLPAPTEAPAEQSAPQARKVPWENSSTEPTDLPAAAEPTPASVPVESVVGNAGDSDALVNPAIRSLMKPTASGAVAPLPVIKEMDDAATDKRRVAIPKEQLY